MSFHKTFNKLCKVHESPETTMIYVNVSDKGLAYDFNRYID